MNDEPHSDDSFSPEKAQEYYSRGTELKSKGQYELALTEFRRAVLANSNLAEAQFEIGLLCKNKAKTDPMFSRYSFEAFKKAAHLDLNNAPFHDQYIVAAQKMGHLDEIHDEYGEWIKQYPENENLKRCAKNITAMTLAMIPEKVNITESGNPGIRKVIFFVSVGFILLGGVLLFVTPLFKGKIPVEKITGLARVGFGCFGVGIIGIAVRKKF